MNQELENNNKVIADIDARIAEETQKLQLDQQAEREAFEKKVQAAKQSVDEIDKELKAVIEQRRDAEEQRSRLRTEKDLLDSKGRELRQQVDNCNHQMNVCKEQLQNDFAIYGNNIRNVIETIRVTSWEGETPIGPLGRYVKLRDQDWANLMRAQIGSMMSAFAVTTTNDRNKLKKILNDTGKYV